MKPIVMNGFEYWKINKKEEIKKSCKNDILRVNMWYN